MTRRPRRWPGIVLLTVGILVVGITVLWIGRDRERPTTFTAPANAATGSEPAAPINPTRSAAPNDSAFGNPAPTPDATVDQSTVAAPPVPTAVAGPPTRLTVPLLAVDAPVDPVLSGGRVLHPPDDPQRVGWWIGSSLAGSDQGSTILVGHVDSAATGPGALFRVTELRPGSEITLHTTDEGTTEDSTVRYAVTALTDYPKTAGLPAELFRSSGPPQLTLITCGGEFDEATGSYADNIVVTATPAA